MKSFVHKRVKISKYRPVAVSVPDRVKECQF